MITVNNWCVGRLGTSAGSRRERVAFVFLGTEVTRMLQACFMSFNTWPLPKNKMISNNKSTAFTCKSMPHLTSVLLQTHGSLIIHWNMQRKPHTPDCASTSSNLLAPSVKQHTTEGQSGEEAYSECILISPVISNIHRQYVI